LARTLQLVSTTQDQSLLTALQFVIAHQDRRAEWTSAGDLDLDFASEKWKEVVFRTRNGRLEMHRRQLEICVFSQVALDLKKPRLV
jgi:hypothetical protein